MALVDPTTPTDTPLGQHAPNITAEVKQKLIDNLQVELSTRARKLRNEANKKAGSLQRKVANRIMRVDTKLRDVTIGELLDSISESLDAPSQNTAIPVNSLTTDFMNAKNAFHHTSQLMASPTRTAGTKRASDEMIGSDKENQGSNIEVAKKRSRVAAVPKSAVDAKAARSGSRKVNPSTVLSPKSHNSRTLPQSPFKPATSSVRFYASRPPSPVKPQSHIAVCNMPPPDKPRTARQKVTVAKTTSSTTTVARGRKAVAHVQTGNRIASDSSTTSTLSTGTMIVTKKDAPVKKGLMSKMQTMASAAGRRVVAGKKDTAAAPAESGRRVLRSRK